MATIDRFLSVDLSDFERDTATMSAMEVGVWLRLMVMAWRNRGPLPNDDDKLARIAGVSRREWTKLKPAVLSAFKVIAADQGEVLVNETWSSRIAEAEAVYAKRKAASDKANAHKSAKGADRDGDRNGNRDGHRLRTHKQEHKQEVSKRPTGGLETSSPGDAGVPDGPAPLGLHQQQAATFEPPPETKPEPPTWEASFERGAAFREHVGKDWPWFANCRLNDDGTGLTVPEFCSDRVRPHLPALGEFFGSAFTFEVESLPIKEAAE